MKIMIENGLKKFREKLVFKDANISFESGTITGLIGRNGSGKTVLFKCILGFNRLTEGVVRIDDKIMGKDIDILKNVGTIIETPGFLNYSTGFDNLMQLYSILNRPDKEHIRNIMSTVGLDWKNKTRVGNYSLGMRQRLAIGQAIMEDPDVIIFDEPMNGLDSKGVEDVRKILLDLKEKGKIIILSSHSSEDINILCDKVFKIEDSVISEIPKD